jgi:alpha-acetolactate decarboxylase
MTTMNRPSICAAALLLAAGCASAAQQSGDVVPQNPSTTVWQVSPFALLVDGAFDGVVTAREVAWHGNMGLGAADELDGEMAVVNGRFYQFGPGGAVATPPPSLALPFAAVTRWSGGVPLQLASGQTFDGSLLPAVDERLPTTDAFYALVLTGTWSEVQARTFKRQTPPYQRINPAMQDLHLPQRAGNDGGIPPAAVRGLAERAELSPALRQ